jgi:hypothetical protein
MEDATLSPETLLRIESLSFTVGCQCILPKSGILSTTPSLGCLMCSSILAGYQHCRVL